MQLVDRALALLPKGGSMLDVPCGFGRVTVRALRQGFQVCAADLSEEMLALTRQNLSSAGLSAEVRTEDVEHLSFGDRRFHAVVCFRLFHHFPSREIRARAVAECCRVANDFVVLSYLSPYSFTSLRRKLRGRKKSMRFTNTLGELRQYFAPHGFRLVQDFSRRPLFSTLHVSVWERIP
jgi:2-polyprenyl-3-methyl-5-hydroxy-6-metoxy-1,4-benzoquinol methylase